MPYGDNCDIPISHWIIWMKNVEHLATCWHLFNYIILSPIFLASSCGKWKRTHTWLLAMTFGNTESQFWKKTWNKLILVIPLKFFKFTQVDKSLNPWKFNIIKYRKSIWLFVFSLYNIQFMRKNIIWMKTTWPRNIHYCSLILELLQPISIT